MDYVCMVGGTLEIKDLNLQLSYLELINLEEDDFKQSVTLRKALRSKQIVKYDPRKHKGARRMKQVARGAPMKLSNRDENKGEYNSLHKKLDSLMSKVGSSSSVNKVETIRKNNNLEEKFDILTQKLDTLCHLMLESQQSNNLESKLNEIIQVLDDIKNKESVIVSGSNTKSNFKKSSDKSYNMDEDLTFIPELNTENIKTSIKTKKVESEGTQSILEKLKKMKEG